MGLREQIGYFLPGQDSAQALPAPIYDFTAIPFFTPINA